MNKWIELMMGLILVLVPIIVAFYSPDWFGQLFNFKRAAWEFLKGGVFWMIVMVGVLFILLGISDLKG